ncbi:MAG: Hsp20/alpha crystallin family protein [Bryobacterales bacterium]|nr:Hsp20/alpha crystallin family protein [Bryobacterales bacterium]
MNVLIRKFSPEEGLSFVLFEEIRDLFDNVQRRAFDRFLQRGASAGGELDDWLGAEREVFFTPHCELVELPLEFRLQIAVPGLDAKEIQIGVMPECLVIRSEAVPKSEGGDAKVLFSDFRGKQLLRRIAFPVEIDPDKVTATLNKGLLHIIATKATRHEAVEIVAAE